MGKQRGKTRASPSHPTRLENWAGIRPRRLKDIDDLCRDAWLEPEPEPEPPPRPYWYATALPDSEVKGEA